MENTEGCELSRIGLGWRSVRAKDTVIIVSRRMRYATVRVHRAGSTKALAADVLAGWSRQYAGDPALRKIRAEKIEIGSTEYAAWWVGEPNVMAHIFVLSKTEGYVFEVKVDLSLSDEEDTKERNMRRVGRLLRPLVRSLENSPVEFFRKCLPDA